MRRLIIALLATGAVVTASLLVYRDNNTELKCVRVAQDVVDAARDNGGGSPQIENLTVGDSGLWCSFEVETGVDLDRGHYARVAIAQEAELALIESSYCGVRVDLVYADGPDTLRTSACPPAQDPPTP